jgi:hypothetical protein
MTNEINLNEDEMEEHKECCIDRPSAWEIVGGDGPVREYACKLHGVPEKYDFSEAERMNNDAWNGR